MKFTLEITCDNDAFADDPNGEIARLLLNAATRLSEENETSGNLYDENGNRVGHFVRLG